MPTVAALGYYGMGNFGDDLILEGLRQLFKGWEMQVYSTCTGGAYPTLNIQKVNACNLFVVGGGELIRKDCLAQPTPSPFKFKNHSNAYKLYNRTFLAHLPYLWRIKTPKALLGCGVEANNAEELKNNVVADLEQFSFIGLRDNQSVEILKQIPSLEKKACLFPDLALALNPPKPAKKSDYAVVIPTHREGMKLTESEAWLKENVVGYKTAWFIPFGKIDNDDYYTARVLSPTLSLNGVVERNFLLPNQINFNEVCKVISGAKAVYTFRLHGLILAYMLGVPCQYYPYHEKLNRVQQTFAGCSVQALQNQQREMFNLLLDSLRMEALIS